MAYAAWPVYWGQIRHLEMSIGLERIANRRPFTGKLFVVVKLARSSEDDARDFLDFECLSPITPQAPFSYTLQEVAGNPT